MVKVNWQVILKWIGRFIVLLISLGVLYLASFWLNEEFQKKKNIREKNKVKAIIAAARETEVSAITNGIGGGTALDVRSIEAITETDPASGQEIVRRIYIYSEDELCMLSVEKRLSGAELTEIHCDGINIPTNDELHIKFDTDEFYHTAWLRSFTDSSDVYLSSYLYDDYPAFVEKLKCSNALALEIPAAHRFWVRFDLSDSKAPMSQLGRQLSSNYNGSCN